MTASFDGYLQIVAFLLASLWNAAIFLNNHYQIFAVVIGVIAVLVLIVYALKKAFWRIAWSLLGAVCWAVAFHLLWEFVQSEAFLAAKAFFVDNYHQISLAVEDYRRQHEL